MSDASVNPSNESPRQSLPPHIASPLPTRSPSPLPIAFPHTEIAIDVDVDEEYPTSIALVKKPGFLSMQYLDKL
jgi:hypothetical protein